MGRLQLKCKALFLQARGGCSLGRNVHNLACKNKTSKISCDSAIGKHLLEYPDNPKTHNLDALRV